MTTISATVIADSIASNEFRKRLTTLQLRYPRVIHSEFMTHRTFSRNASSSRAIPVERLIKDVEENPFIPLVWGANKPGMQAGDEIFELVDLYHKLRTQEEAWLIARDNAVHAARAFAAAGYHKQIVNRLLEPWAHINVVVTATEWGNFFMLRDHPDAEPHIRLLAQAIKKAMDLSTPRELGPEEWHLPYITDEDYRSAAGLDAEAIRANWRNIQQVVTLRLIKMSVARCARVSYRTHDGAQPKAEEDLILYDRLMGAQPWHASPSEHAAVPEPTGFNGHTGNFTGWCQLRKLLEAGVFNLGT